MSYKIIQKFKVLVNHDPQKRCYNGAYANASYEWTNWETLESNIPDDKIDSRLDFWRGLNAYAVSQRGVESKREFKKVKENDETI